jgi:muramoyltetrapeptide carboxypeptidase LdcA involved in peptidoglycan recycling
MAGSGLFPRKLRPGDQLRAIAPARSLAMIPPPSREAATARLGKLGFTVSFGDHVEEQDVFVSSSVAHRVADLHAAFADPSVAGILTVIGGFNSNELLPHLDWDLIRANPKVFCGYSDITALQNAIYAHTGLVTYSGPHYSTFAMRDYAEDTVTWFADCLTSDKPLLLRPAATWTDDEWWMDQDARNPRPGDGWWVLREGRGSGTILGGNLTTITFLQGTPHMPAASRCVLFVEDDYESQPHHFARNLTSLLQAIPPEQVSALLIGRFQAASEMTRPVLAEIVARQPLAAGTPVVANLDFGHTSPLLTFPVGGSADVLAAPAAGITVTAH